MRKLFSPLPPLFMLLIACAAAHAQPAARQQAAPKPPPAPCDDSAREELYRRFRENSKGSPEQKMEAYKAANEYICRCAEYDDRVTVYLSNWLGTYDNPDYFYPNLQAAAEAVAREDAQRPRCRCDEMREQLVSSLRGRVSGRDNSQKYDETVRKFLKLCGDSRRPIDRDLGEWLTKYDKSVREFEEKQQKDEPPAKGPAKEQ